MTTGKDDRRERTARLKALREQHAETIAATRERLKAQQAARRAICSAMRGGARTVPEIAAASELPAQEVLWHVTAMKKYDDVVEIGQCGEYYQYALTKEQA